MTDEMHNDGFPASLTEYRCVSCLKANDRAATYLAKHRATGGKAIVKVSDDPDTVHQLRNEVRLLKMIHSTGDPSARFFPEVITCREEDGAVTLVRSFLKGEAVDQLVETRTASPGMAREEAISCVTEVLGLLKFLHHMEPPIIHRDIKPQNIVIDPEGHCHLIDLGISRLHSDRDDLDTRVMGTRVTAPPEQFGYRQTDARSDIYSVGVLLRYCLTGEYEQQADEALEPDIRRVVERATMFDPALRYQRAEDMLDALRRLKRGQKRPARLVLIPLALAAIILLIVLWHGLPGHYDLKGVYHFEEPLIEQAVRLAIGKEEGGLTRADLAKVTAIEIFGRYIASSSDEFRFLGEFTQPYDLANMDDDWRENGGITSLKDVDALPNLKTLGLYRQSVKDIGALRDTRITSLGLGFDPIEDLTPLVGNGNIQYLNLTDVDTDDIDSLASMPNLTRLELGGTSFQDLDGLEALPIEVLGLVNTPVTDFSAMGGMTSLHTLTINKAPEGLIEALANTPIAELDITGEEATSLSSLNALDMLEVLEYRTAEYTELSDLKLTLPALRQLTLKNVGMDDLRMLSELYALQMLDIRECDVRDMDGLENLNVLATIRATEAQARALEERYPEHTWKIEN